MKGFDPETEDDGINRHQCLSYLAANRFPLGAIWVVACECTGSWKQTGIARLRCLDHGPEPRSQGGTVRFQGITQNREFGRCGIGEAVVEIIDLRSIDREEGKAGMELLPRPSRSFFQFAFQ